MDCVTPKCTSIRPYLVVPALLLGLAVFGVSAKCRSDGPAQAKPAGTSDESAPLTFGGKTVKQVMDDLNGDSKRKLDALHCIWSPFYSIDNDELFSCVFGLLIDDDAIVRECAELAMSSPIYDWRRVATPALSSPHANLVCKALESFQTGGPVDNRVLDTIRHLSADRRERVALAASYTLWFLTEEWQELKKSLAASLDSTDDEVRTFALKLICKSPEIGPLVKEQLPAMLKSNSHTLAARSAIAMIKCNMSVGQALQLLRLQMTNDDELVRLDVLRLVTRNCHRNAGLVGIVLTACCDRSKSVRRSAQLEACCGLDPKDLPRDKAELFREGEDDEIEFVLSFFASRDIVAHIDMPLLERYQNSRNEDLSLMATLMIAKNTGRWDEAEKRVGAILDSAPGPSNKLWNVPLFALQRPALANKVLNRLPALEMKQNMHLLEVAIAAGPNDPAVKEFAKRLVNSTDAETVAMVILKLRDTSALPEWGIDLLRQACATPNRSLRRLACVALMRKSQAPDDMKRVLAVSRNDNWQQHYPSDLAWVEFHAKKDGKTLALQLGQICKSRGLDAALNGLREWERTADDETLDRSLASIIGSLSIADQRNMNIRIEERNLAERVLGRPVIKNYRKPAPAGKVPTGVE